MQEFIPPNMGTGRARNATESAYPHLWKDILGYWSPSMGPTGQYLVDYTGRNAPSKFTLNLGGGAITTAAPTWIGDGDANHDGGYALSWPLVSDHSGNYNGFPVLVHKYASAGGDPLWLNAATGFTVSWRIKVNGAPSTGLQPWFVTGPGLGSPSYSDSGNALYVFVASGGASVNYNGSSMTSWNPLTSCVGGGSPFDGKWHTWTLVVKPGGATAVQYMDGRQVASGTISISWSTTNPLGIYIGGAGNVGGNPFLMDDFGVWGRVLQPSEIMQLSLGASPLQFVKPMEWDYSPALNQQSFIASVLTITSTAHTPASVGSSYTFEAPNQTITSSIHAPTIGEIVKPSALTLSSSLHTPQSVGLWYTVPTALNVPVHTNITYQSFDYKAHPAAVSIVSNLIYPLSRGGLGGFGLFYSDSEPAGPAAGTFYNQSTPYTNCTYVIFSPPTYPGSFCTINGFDYTYQNIAVGDPTQPYMLDGSLDGISWTNLASVTMPTSFSGVNHVPVTTDLTTKWVYFRIVGPNNVQINTGTFQVYGTVYPANNITENPSIVSAAFSTHVPTIKFDCTARPASIVLHGVVGGVPGITTFPSVLNRTLTLHAPSVHADLTFEESAPLNIVSEVYPITYTNAITVKPASIVLASQLLHPAVGPSQKVTPSTFTRTFVLHAPHISAGPVVSPTTLNITSATHVPTVKIGEKEIVASPLSATFTLHAPTRIGSFQVITPTTFNITSLTHTPAFHFDYHLSVTSLSIVSAIQTPAPAVIGGAFTNPSGMVYFNNTLAISGDESPAQLCVVSIPIPASLLSGGTVTASSFNGTLTNASFVNGWTSGLSSGFPSWLEYDLGSGHTATPTSMVMTGYSSPFSPASPTAFQLQGSNDNATWTSMLSVTMTLAAWEAKPTQTFNFANSTAYRYFRIYVTAGDGTHNYCQLSGVSLYGAIVPSFVNYQTPGVNSAEAIAYNSLTGKLYMACAAGKLLEFNTSGYSFIDNVTGASGNLTSIALLPQFDEVYAGTDYSVGEVVTMYEGNASVVSTDIRCAQLVNSLIGTYINTVNGAVMATDIRVSQLVPTIVGCDIRCIAEAFATLGATPISRPDFVVTIGGIEAPDVQLDSIEITHTADEKSECTFILARKHDQPDYTLAGSYVPVTGQQAVTISINGNEEFGYDSPAYVWDVDTKSESETVKITCYSEVQKQDYANNVSLSLPSVNEKLHLYHVLVQDPVIDNPMILADDINPPFYQGILIDTGYQEIQYATQLGTNGGQFPFGQSAEQRVNYILGSGDSGVYDFNGDSIYWTPDPNYTYFWFVYGTNFLSGDVLQGSGADAYSGMGANAIQNNLAYIGTSLSPVTSDAWDITDINFLQQRVYPYTKLRGPMPGSSTIYNSDLFGITLFDESVLRDHSPYGTYSGAEIDAMRFSLITASNPQNVGFTAGLYNASWASSKLLDVIDAHFGVTFGSAPFKKVSAKNGWRAPTTTWQDQSDGLYIHEDAGYDYISYINQVGAIELKKIQNINGTILPKTKCDIEMFIDGYYYFNISLLNRINLDNTTTANVYNNNNGFPVSVKSIHISSKDMKVSLSCSNAWSRYELLEMEAGMPDPNFFVQFELRQKIANKYNPATLQATQ